MEQQTQPPKIHPMIRQTVAGTLTMVVVSAALLFAAWLTTSAPLVKDPVQTELLYVTVYLSRNECVTWHPQSMVDRQTARAIVDYMGDCRERPTLRPAREILETRPRMEVHFRTEDTYRVAYLGSWEKSGATAGWVGDQDYSGLAARVLNANLLMNYICEQIGDNLPMSKDS